MSLIFDKSTSKKYSKYFESISDMGKPFRRYSLDKGRVIPKDIISKKPWEMGQAGVPLAWDERTRTVTIDHTDSHTLVIGPTGSKKSRLVVMPLVRILGSAGESMIISDPKAEIYNRTASYLEKQNYSIFVLNLRSPMHGKRWNPLALPYSFFLRGEIDKAYEFVNDIAENLIHSEKSQNDPFWDNSAGSFFFGLVLLLFKYCHDFNLGKEYVHIGNVVRLRNALISGQRLGKNGKLWEYAKTDPIISSALIGTIETANDTRAGILSVFDQKVRMFSIQPNLLDMLSDNDIDFDIIGKKPTAVFLIVPDEKTGYHGLVSLFIKQSYEYMIYKAQISENQDGFHVGTLSNRVNYVLDEFSSLPTIRDFPSMITAARSRNIRFTLVLQSKHQLLQRYNEETDIIQTNCNNWIFLTSREIQLLEEISSMCGKTATNDSRPVLSVSALQRLDKDEGEALLLCGRTKPCITRLPDIELYDRNSFNHKHVSSRKSTKVALLDFVIPLSDKEEIQHRTPERDIPLQSLDLNSIVASIDRKIAELEKEEENRKKQEEQALGLSDVQNDERG